MVILTQVVTLKRQLVTTCTELQTAVDGGDASGGAGLDSYMANLDLLSAMQDEMPAWHSPGAKGLEGELEHLFKSLFGVQTSTNAVLESACTERLRVTVTKITAQTSLLKLVAGGDVKGRSWYHSFDTKKINDQKAVLEWLKDICKNIDAKSIEDKLNLAVQALFRLDRFSKTCSLGLLRSW